MEVDASRCGAREASGSADARAGETAGVADTARLGCSLEEQTWATLGASKIPGVPAIAVDAGEAAGIRDAAGGARRSTDAAWLVWADVVLSGWTRYASIGWAEGKISVTLDAFEGCTIDAGLAVACAGFAGAEPIKEDFRSGAGGACSIIQAHIVGAAQAGS